MENNKEEKRFLYTQENSDQNSVEISERHQAIITEYFNNGYNGSKAVRDINKTNTGNEGRLFKQIYDRPEIQNFIKQHQIELQNRTNIKQAQIVKELINFSFADNSQFINLTPDQIKELPPEVKRLISSFDHKVNVYTDRNDIQHREETIRIKFVDKLKAIDMLNKHLGIYNADNQQKQTKVNIEQLDSITLNNILNVLKTQ